MHQSYDSYNFVDLDQSYQSKVKVGNDDLVEVKGQGEVVVQTKTGTKLIVDVLFVPEISQSLLSVGQMLERNHSLHFQDSLCVILESDEIELKRVRMHGKTFPVEWGKIDFQTFSASADESELWHKNIWILSL